MPPIVVLQQTHSLHFHDIQVPVRGWQSTMDRDGGGGVHSDLFSGKEARVQHLVTKRAKASHVSRPMGQLSAYYLSYTYISL